MVRIRIKLHEGEHLDFYCPLCNKSLSSFEDHINLARVIRMNAEGKKAHIAFSKIVGEKCTYLIDKSEVKGFGPDSPGYKNYWDEGPEY
ncbi:MAG: hypothetical protein K9G67_07765 [Bacteroidales bacterium]|nr:hypothetical protein [Bacteroidales bacterium]MCF8344365.1 hypothetical protein [Bacteroidales bacterium]MCF8351684.1 hypothetical protein [Bacteroidales bacterium]MCF8376237.1 hypothetical protein [Bacteroidales bacterium]MCF8401206.1 hypothetical protein [Bacteroidales bacterium]